MSLPVAVRGTGTAVGWVESCLCNANYSGPSCTKCAPGFYRQTDGSCIQCDCFGNSSQLSCDPNTGECVVCPPSTTGASCESCVPGYYGSPSDGISCLPCACPGQYSGSFSPLCELIPPAFLPTDTPPGQDLECTNCSRGHEGMRCELCQENYYGDPVNSIGCIPCDCNGNIALEEPGNCNTSSGVCLRCVGNTTGESCQVCATGFYGDAIQAKNCSRCMCDLMGELFYYDTSVLIGIMLRTCFTQERAIRVGLISITSLSLRPGNSATLPIAVIQNYRTRLRR